MLAQKEISGRTQTVIRRRKKVLKGLIDGLNLKEAALAAGYKESTADVACRDIMPHIREAFQHSLHHRISIGKMADTVAAGLDAEQTEFFQKDGIVTDQRNVIAWGERRRYAELAANLMDLQSEKTTEQKGGNALLIEVVSETSMTRIGISSNVDNTPHEEK